MCDKEKLNIILKSVNDKMNSLFNQKLKDVVLYGSHARSEAKEDSDIDILVIVDMDKKELANYRDEIFEFVNLLDLEYDVFISILLQDYFTFNKWKKSLPFFVNVLKEGIYQNG